MLVHLQFPRLARAFELLTVLPIAIPEADRADEAHLKAAFRAASIAFIAMRALAPVGHHREGGVLHPVFLPELFILLDLLIALGALEDGLLELLRL